MRRLDLANQRFGRLVAIRDAGKNKNGQRLWLCRCDCGEEKIAIAAVLKSGILKSCRCLQREGASLRFKGKRLPHLTKHGKTGTVEYRIWASMRQRCNNPKAKHWGSYGGRGIKVCPQWDDFEQFLADVGPRPSAKHSLDRWPDRNGNYEPGNVRWATSREQVLNRRPYRCWNNEDLNNRAMAVLSLPG